MLVEELLGLLDGVKQSGQNWIARCPGHSDRVQSLSIGLKEDKIVLKCFAGCEFPHIVASMGLKEQDFFMESDRPKREPLGKPVAEWIYRDEQGNPAYKTIRFEREDGTKTFRQKHLEGSEWLWGMNGQKRYPYRLPELLEAAKSRWIAVVEGEKCADQMEKLGIFATTNSGGAGKWEDGWASYFAGAKVVIIPDNDDPGNAHARNVGWSLQKTAAQVRLLRLPNLPIKGDVVDWVQSGGTSDQLKTLISEAPLFTDQKEIYLSSVDLASKEINPPRWVIPDLLPEGLVVLAGAPKVRKSWLALDLCGAVGGYGKAFDAVDVVTGSSLYYGLEDNWWRLRARMRHIWGDDVPRQMYWSIECPRIWSPEFAIVEEWLRSHPDARLVVFDTLSRIWPKAKYGETGGSYQGDSEKMEVLQKMAARHHVAIVCVHHTRKPDPKKQDDDPMMEISGTNGILGVCDGALLLRRPREDNEGTLTVVGRDVGDQVLDLTMSPTFGDDSKSGWRWIKNDLGHQVGHGTSEVGHVPGAMSQEILGFLRFAGRPEQAAELAQRLGKNHDAVRKMLYRLQKAGLVEYVGKADGWRATGAGKVADTENVRALDIYRKQEEGDA